MGVHARRAARRTTPLVAAAAGIGTVAAMLGSPMAAHAASIVLDPAYGNKTGTVFAGAISGNAAGLIPVRGVDAVDVYAGSAGQYSRVVLGQEGTGARRVTLTKFLPNGSALDSTFGVSGQVAITVPTGTTVDRLLFDATATFYWVVGHNSSGLVIIKLDASGNPLATAAAGSPSTGFGTSGVLQVPVTAAGLASGSSWAVVDAELAVSASNAGLAIALNSWSPTNVPSARVIKINATGTTTATGATTGLDATFAGTGYWVVPNAMSIGGIAVRPSTSAFNVGDIVGTFQAPSGTFTSGTADPSEASGDSGIFDITATGALNTNFGVTTHGSVANPGGTGSSSGTPGISDAFEMYAELTSPTGAPSKSRWTDEVLGDLAVVGTAGEVVVTGRTGGSTFLADVITTAGTPSATSDFGVLNAAGFGRLGGSATSSTGGGGVSTVSTSCSGGRSQVVVAGTSYYVSNVCDDGKPELIKLFANGIADTDFNGGSAVWRSDLPVNARPITYNAAFGTTAGLRIGSASSDGSDAATAQLTAALAPSSAPTISSTNALSLVSGTTYATVVAAGSAVTLVASPAASGGGTPSPAFRWEARGNSSAAWVPVQNSDKEMVSGANMRQLRITTGGDMDGRQYRVVAFNATGSLPSTTIVQLNVLPIAPAITKQPQSTSGEEGGWATFAAEASGDPRPAWNWQWQGPGQMTWNDIMNGPNIEGATTPMLKIKNLTKGLSGNKYRAIASNSADTVFTDGKATLMVTDKGTHEPEPEPDTAVWGDYNGDGKTDIAAYKDGQFYWNGADKPDMFGQPGDKLVVGNFDSDAAFDKAVVRGATWITDGNPNVGFGRATDMPVSGDFDGDGQTDIAVWRPSNGTWYVQDGDTVQWGQAGDIPVPGDYDGDGSDEFAVFRPSNGIWYVYGAGRTTYGKSGDLPVRGDWNGDGKTDPAVFRPSNSTWYILGVGTTQFGAKGDVPLAGDFDGDGKSDRATYRPSNSTWNFQGKPSVKFGGAGWWPITGVK